MESLPLELLGHITHHLPASDVMHLAQTNQQMLRSIQTLYQRPQDDGDGVAAAFRMGLWFGTANASRTHLEFSNGPMHFIRRSDKESHTKITVAFNDDPSFFWNHATLLDALRQWLRYYLGLRTPFRIVLTTSRLLRPFQHYAVTSRRRKRDHCNIIGITIGFHEYLPMFSKDLYQFDQRIGFNWNLMTSPFSDENLTLNLVSEIHISPYTHVMADRSKSIHHSIDLVLTATHCYARMHSPNPPFATSEMFHTHLELYANAVYNLLETVDYDAQLKNAEAQRPHLAYKFQRSVADIRLDVPATIDDVWNLLQRMELRFTRY